MTDTFSPVLPSSRYCISGEVGRDFDSAAPPRGASTPEVDAMPAAAADLMNSLRCKIASMSPFGLGGAPIDGAQLMELQTCSVCWMNAEGKRLQATFWPSAVFGMRWTSYERKR